MRTWHILAPIAVVAACHLDRLVNGSGGRGGGGGPPPPGPPTTLVFTVQPRGAMPDSTIKPPVQVTARDSAGNTSTNFTGIIRVTIATDGSAHKNAKLAGDTSVTAVAGVATFTDLSVDQIGTGYTLSAALATGGSMGTSAPFDVDSGPPPPPPPSGDLTVTTTTSGSNQPSGYTVTVDGGQSQSINATGTTTYNGLTATTHSVQLNGVPSNCTVSEANPQTVPVPANGTGQASFTITCAALTGSLTVTTTTSGSNQPSGYTVTVDGGQSKSIAASGTASYSGLTATNHSVHLNGVPSNCTVSEANPQTVSVPANGIGQASFTITCAPPPNQPPVVDAGPSANLLVGALYTENASFTDPDHNGPWSYTIDWGDGTSSTGSATSEGTISATHTYLLANSYTITVTVTDAAGGRGSDQKVVTVTL